MRILDKNNIELENPDYSKGRLHEERILIKHHEATEAKEAVKEVGHFETIREYPNGGKDVEWVVDTPGIDAVEAKEAWDEYEDIYRFVEFTEDDYAASARHKRNKMLATCDWTQVLDAPIDTATRETYRVYRQALRDITEQSGFPMTIEWPQIPAITKAAPEPIDTTIVNAYAEGVDSV